MGKGKKFTLVYDPETIHHVGAIEPKYHRMIRQVLAEQLSHQPAVLTRNRKPLEMPSAMAATWELRFGPANRFRAFYAVDEEEQTVKIKGIGVKEGNRLKLGGEEVEL
jgi:hypothetical protein